MLLFVVRVAPEAMTLTPVWKSLHFTDYIIWNCISNNPLFSFMDSQTMRGSPLQPSPKGHSCSVQSRKYKVQTICWNQKKSHKSNTEIVLGKNTLLGKSFVGICPNNRQFKHKHTGQSRKFCSTASRSWSYRKPPTQHESRSHCFNWSICLFIGRSSTQAQNPWVVTLKK